jgi:hypothetical protein
VAFDVGPCNVYDGKRLVAPRARVIYEDGRLYVVRSSTAVRSWATSEPVSTGSETWMAGQFKITRRGCSTCGWQLKGLSKAQLIINAVEAP